MQIKEFQTINSTNTYALEHFDELDDLCVISAHSQTQGRGRFDRKWISKDYENIYITFVLKPQNTKYITNLTQYLSVVTANVLENYKVTPQIKWPNDVLINQKKICGILCESKLKENKIQGVVLGIGINLNQKQETIDTIERPATSLNLEIGKSVNKQEFLNNLISEFEKNYEKVLKNGFLSFKEDYLKRAIFLNKQIFIQQRDGDKKEEYTVINLDKNGNLIVLTKDNTTKTILSGDMIL